MITRNPVEWVWARFMHAASAVGSAGHSLHHIQETIHSPAPAIRKIGFGDVTDAIAKGFEDFGALRSDVVFLCVAYPVMGLVLARLAFGNELLPLLFPLASGFALIGPFAAVGLYEMSRRREQGLPASWGDAFGVFHAPAFGAIAILGLVLVGLFLLWLGTAWLIYDDTLGPNLPVSLSAFAHDVVATPQGHLMIVEGFSAGFIFALLAMALSVVSFPLLLDRDVGFDTAVATSFRAVATNPGPMAFWGAIVASSLVIGSLPLFTGLIVVMPVLGHATWHLYRKLVAR